MTASRQPNNARPDTMRLFIAVELPDSWRDALAGAQDKLRRRLAAQDLAALRWVRPEAIHLTLKFLGQTPTARLAAIEEALAAAVAQPPAIALSLSEPGWFASGPRIRVLWAGVAGDLEALDSLARSIDEACARAGFDREQRPFSPHLTLARVPETARLARDTLAPLLRDLHLEAPPLTVGHVSLMRSHPGPTGARYERLATWPAQSS